MADWRFHPKQWLWFTSRWTHPPWYVWLLTVCLQVFAPLCDQGFRNDLRRVKELPKSFPAKQQVRQPLAAAWKRPGHERTAGGWCVRPQGGPQVNHCQHNHNNGGNCSGHITQTHTHLHKTPVYQVCLAIHLNSVYFEMLDSNLSPRIDLYWQVMTCLFYTLETYWKEIDRVWIHQLHSWHS